MHKLVFCLSLLISWSLFAFSTQVSNNHLIYTLDQFDITESTNPRVSESIPAGSFSSISVQCRHSSVGGSSATYRVESSNNNTNWDVVSGSSVTTTGDAGSNTVVLDPFPMRFARVRVTTSATAGDLDCIALGRGHK